MSDQRVLRICGACGIAGALFAIAADVASWFLAEGYSPVSQSISALAVGKASWLIDLGLWAFALACVATGVGMLALRHSTTTLRRVAAIASIMIGIGVAVIATVNQYAGTDNAGANVHTAALYLLYLSFATAALPGGRLQELGSGAAAYSRAAGWIWIVLAPVYYFWYPSDWAGAFERTLALLIIVWVLLVARRLRLPAEERTGQRRAHGA